jgi:hypothetical protein
MLRGFAEQISAALDADEAARPPVEPGGRDPEASFARDIQLGLMPASYEDLGACEAGFGVRPAAGSGGAVVRLVRLEGGSHAALVGRVSGTGAAAALVAVKTGEAFRLLARSGVGAGELMRALDAAATEGLRHEMRASAALIMLDADGATAEVAVAGGSCAKLGRTGNPAWCRVEGRPLGVRVPGSPLPLRAACPLALAPGEGVLLLGDCPDARGAAGAGPGRIHVEACARANARRPVGDFAGGLAADIERLRAGAARSAEVCVAVVRRKPAA